MVCYPTLQKEYKKPPRGTSGWLSSAGLQSLLPFGLQSWAGGPWQHAGNESASLFLSLFLAFSIRRCGVLLKASRSEASEEQGRRRSGVADAWLGPGFFLPLLLIACMLDLASTAHYPPPQACHPCSDRVLADNSPPGRYSRDLSGPKKKPPKTLGDPERNDYSTSSHACLHSLVLLSSGPSKSPRLELKLRCWPWGNAVRVG